MTAFHVGIDLGKYEFVVAAAPEGLPTAKWRTLGTKTFANDAAGIAAFIAWLGALPGPVACLCAESTGPLSWRLMADLARTGLFPGLSICNPRWVKGTGISLGLREKTDPLDARVIAMHALIHKPAPTRQRPEAMEELEELFRTREAILSDIIGLRNRIDAARTAVVKKELEKTLRELQKREKSLMKEIDKRVAENELLSTDYSLLVSVPGIGKILAVALLAELGDLRTYSRGQIVSFAGVFPAAHQSGTSVKGKPHLMKGGGKRVRSKLYMGALACIANKNQLVKTYDHLLEQGKIKMVALGAQMRKLLLVARAVVISGKPFDPVKFQSAANACCAS